jgi:hypothetical protein
MADDDYANTFHADNGRGDGRYQVWQDRGWPESRLADILHGEQTPFPEGYVHVANVQAESLAEAVELTVDTGSFLRPDGDPPHKPWGRNEGVEVLVKPPYSRDTDVGDVIVDPQGLAYRVERHGFSEVKAAEHALSSPAAIADDRDVVPAPEGANIADKPAQYQSPPKSIELARELMRDIKEALTTDADGKFPAKYADVDWDGMNMQPEETAWQHMDMGQRYDLLLHALDESIWSLEPSAKWDEMRDSQKLAMEFVKEDVRQATPGLRADAFDAVMKRLEAFADEFARLARTREQTALAEKFGDFVSDEGHTAIAWLAEARRDVSPASDVELFGELGMDELPARMQRLSPVGEQQRQAMAAFTGKVSEIAHDWGVNELIADGVGIWTDRERLGILAAQAVELRMDEEVFVRTARRVLGGREPTVEQRGWIADAWVRAESREFDAEQRLSSPGELAEDRGGPDSPGPERGSERGR